MPRIKYRRSYDFDLYEQSDERDFEEGGSGNSWLSNAAIASQLSDAKIRQTISALKAQITVLETELLSRHLINGNSNRRNWDEIGSARRKKDGERLYYRADSESSGRNNKKVDKLSAASIKRTLKKLGIKDVNTLLAEWGKILEEGKSDEK